MVDGSKRKRRNRHDARARFYAVYRSARFCARFGLGNGGSQHIDVATVCFFIQCKKKESD